MINGQYYLIVIGTVPAVYLGPGSTVSYQRQVVPGRLAIGHQLARGLQQQ
jgi:hypothetical protein